LLSPRPVHVYTAGSWGPQEADTLVEQNGLNWQLGW
jgi:glucose-6-phosphate 1-dehydrogenase